MKVFLSRLKGGKVMVQARPESEGAVGDLTQVIESDGGFLGWSLRELWAMGDGEHDLEPKHVPEGKVSRGD